MKGSKYISEASGFKVPDAYFAEFKVKDLKKDVKCRDAGFVVPDNYFEAFSVSLPQKSKTVNLKSDFKIYAIAASLILILGSALLTTILDFQADQSLNFSKIDKTEMQNYIEDQMLMDQEFYLEDEAVNFQISSQNFDENTIIDDMDDISIEQLMDY